MSWVAWGMAFILTGGASAVALRRTGQLADRFFTALVTAGCLVAALPAVQTLRGGAPRFASIPAGVPGGPWLFGLDPLSAWFLLTVLLVGGATAVYGTTYLAPERGHRNVAGAHALLAILLVALAGVVTAHAVIPFLVAWEVMALSAYFLVMFESDDAEVRRAGLVYIVLTHLSTLALIAMFATLSAPGGELTFSALAEQGANLGPATTPFLVLALVGFGVKAGIVPLHFWLPGAHTAAPSHVSALLSGVMIKIGIYGLLRVVLLSGAPPPAWWGWLLFGLGLASGILGVLWALAQHDLKRLLAYHSVENIGIILLGLGLGVLGMAYQHPGVAVLGFTGAVLHTLNHALFKSLLFLGAGAVVQATKTRVIDRLGGLARRMPGTALAFGIGSAAIVGLPPLNGFLSEWVIFSALLQSGATHEPLRMAVVGVAGLALIGGLALACFTKVGGALFLGLPRSAATQGAADPGRGMRLAGAILAAGCVLIGLLPVMVVRPAIRVADSLIAGVGQSIIAPSIAGSSGAVTATAVTLYLLTGLVLFARRRIQTREPATSDTWACGGTPITARTQYTASSYAAPLLHAFGPMTGVHETRSATALSVHPTDPVLDRAVFPIWDTLGRVTQGIRGVPGGRLRWYLLAVIVTLTALLFYLALQGGGGGGGAP